MTDERKKLVEAKAAANKALEASYEVLNDARKAWDDAYEAQAVELRARYDAHKAIAAYDREHPEEVEE